LRTGGCTGTTEKRLQRMGSGLERGTNLEGCERGEMVRQEREEEQDIGFFPRRAACGGLRPLYRALGGGKEREGGAYQVSALSYFWWYGVGPALLFWQGGSWESQDWLKRKGEREVGCVYGGDGFVLLGALSYVPRKK